MSSAPSSALRILVADDERDTVETLRLVLQDEGHEVHAVHRGPEVLRAVLRLDPEWATKWRAKSASAAATRGRC